jgi:hypothetical protein
LDVRSVLKSGLIAACEQRCQGAGSISPERREGTIEPDATIPIEELPYLAILSTVVTKSRPHSEIFLHLSAGHKSQQGKPGEAQRVDKKSKLSWHAAHWSVPPVLQEDRHRGGEFLPGDSVSSLPLSSALSDQLFIVYKIVYLQCLHQDGFICEVMLCPEARVSKAAKSEPKRGG